MNSIDQEIAEVVAEKRRLKDENASLRDQLRLAHDKLAEQVRQARWEVADTAISKGRGADAYLWEVRDANAPKD